MWNSTKPNALAERLSCLGNYSMLGIHVAAVCEMLWCHFMFYFNLFNSINFIKRNCFILEFKPCISIIESESIFGTIHETLYYDLVSPQPLHIWIILTIKRKFFLINLYHILFHFLTDLILSHQLYKQLKRDTIISPLWISRTEWNEKKDWMNWLFANNFSHVN